LARPFFFEEADWIPVPKSCSPNIVSFKTCDTDDAKGLAFLAACLYRKSKPGHSVGIPVMADRHST